MIVSDEKAEEAINFLAETDWGLAQAKYTMEAMARKQDLIEKEVFLHEEGNIEQRKAAARTHETTKEANREYLRAMREYEKLKNQRDTAQTTIWVWKTAKNSERATV
jgi:hypothetical protein